MTMTADRTDSERLVALEVKVDAVHEDLHSIWKAIDRASNRPPWGVTVLLTVLSSLVVGLAVAFAAQLGA